MKSFLKPIIAMMMLMTLASGSAWADHFRGGGFYHGGGYHGGGYYHNHVRSHVYLGLGFGPYWGSGWGPGFYSPGPYYSYYPYEPRIVVESPPVYIERADQQSAGSGSSGAGNYWYYCHDAKRYYPYVKDCPGGWQRVSPLPPDSR